jgi:hypothetical protein
VSFGKGEVGNGGTGGISSKGSIVELFFRDRLPNSPSKPLRSLMIPLASDLVLVMLIALSFPFKLGRKSSSAKSTVDGEGDPISE